MFKKNQRLNKGVLFSNKEKFTYFDLKVQMLVLSLA